MSTTLFKNITAAWPPDIVALSPCRYPSEATVRMQMGDFSGSGIINLRSAPSNRSTTQASSPSPTTTENHTCIIDSIAENCSSTSGPGTALSRSFPNFTAPSATGPLTTPSQTEFGLFSGDALNKGIPMLSVLLLFLIQVVALS